MLDYAYYKARPTPREEGADNGVTESHPRRGESGRGEAHGRVSLFSCVWLAYANRPTPGRDVTKSSKFLLENYLTNQ